LARFCQGVTAKTNGMPLNGFQGGSHEEADYYEFGFRFRDFFCEWL